MMLVSLVIYMANRKSFPDPSKKAAAGAKVSAEEIKMSAQEIRQRVYALFAVFGVVIFFWVSFHQNGYSLTYFARDYVNLDVINIDLGFTTIKGAEIFQSVNPFFVVFLTPIIMWFFGWLRKRNIEVSTPMKIAIGMGIAALAYVFLMLFSLALPTKTELAGMRADEVQSLLVGPLFHPHRRRIVHFAAGPRIRVEGGAAPHAGPDAGLLAGRYGRGQRPAVRRRMALPPHADVGHVGRVRRRLRSVDARHALDGPLARAGHQIIRTIFHPAAAENLRRPFLFTRPAEI